MSKQIYDSSPTVDTFINPIFFYPKINYRAGICCCCLCVSASGNFKQLAHDRGGTAILDQGNSADIPLEQTICIIAFCTGCSTYLILFCHNHPNQMFQIDKVAFFFDILVEYWLLHLPSFQGHIHSFKWGPRGDFQLTMLETELWLGLILGFSLIRLSYGHGCSQAGVKSFMR